MPTIPDCPLPRMLSSVNRLLTVALASSVVTAQHQHQPNMHLVTRPRQERLQVVEAAPATEEPGLLSRIVGEETQGKVVDSIITWAKDKAKENPGCVERFVCEMYRTGETMEGLPYLLMQITK